MNANIARKALIATAGALVVGGAASAAEIFVSENISTSVTWTADNVYACRTRSTCCPARRLTIEPGTVIASIPTTDGSGSLAVCRGAQIYVLGTAANPVIMTSANDDFVTWREAANEWGNLTDHGPRLHLRDRSTPGNTASCNANNVAPMEGLIAAFPGDTDASSTAAATTTTTAAASATSRSATAAAWSASATSSTACRSAASVARPTSSHVEIMNNVDDGIEIWGGTVNLKYFSIWNIGDDSFDIDQGWRGKAQFGLIVQGYSLDAEPGLGRR